MKLWALFAALVLVISIFGLYSNAQDCVCSPTVNLNRECERDVIRDRNVNVTCAGLVEMESKFLARLDADCSKFRPKDCSDVKKQTADAKTAIYRVFPKEAVDGLFVRCDMTTDGGGWTVFQRRENGNIQFYRGWLEYQAGFGDLETEFWLGNQQIHMLSSHGWNELRIDMVDHDNKRYHAEYQVFSVGDAISQYQLFVDGYRGNTTFDGMAHHSGRKFSTKDRDNDQHKSHCAQVFSGAWWYGTCHNSNLNGQYGPKTGLVANSWNFGSNRYIAFKFTEMKMRRVL